MQIRALVFVGGSTWTFCDAEHLPKAREHSVECSVFPPLEYDLAEANAAICQFLGRLDVLHRRTDAQPQHQWTELVGWSGCWEVEGSAAYLFRVVRATFQLLLPYSVRAHPDLTDVLTFETATATELATYLHRFRDRSNRRVFPAGLHPNCHRVGFRNTTDSHRERQQKKHLRHKQEGGEAPAEVPEMPPGGLGVHAERAHDQPRGRTDDQHIGHAQQYAEPVPAETEGVPDEVVRKQCVEHGREEQQRPHHLRRLVERDAQHGSHDAEQHEDAGMARGKQICGTGEMFGNVA